MGEDVGKLGGVFRVTDGLQKDFGEDRVIDTPLAESGIVGTAIGLALRGYRPVCEIQFDGFVYPAFDQIVSRSPDATAPGAVRCHHHPCAAAASAPGTPLSARGLFTHTSGLRVVCLQPQDAYTMISRPSPRMIRCSRTKRRYHDREWTRLLTSAPPVPGEPASSPRQDVTLVAYGRSSRPPGRRARRRRRSVSVEVIDLRSLARWTSRRWKPRSEDRPARHHA
jgi:pyruvate dehydrogenase E1 component beta subunit